MNDTNNNTAGEHGMSQMSDDVEYNTLDYEQIGSPVIQQSQQGNHSNTDTNRASQASDYLEPVAAPPEPAFTSPYEQLSGHYANEPIGSGKPYENLKQFAEPHSEILIID